MRLIGFVNRFITLLLSSILNLIRVILYNDVMAYNGLNKLANVVRSSNTLCILGNGLSLNNEIDSLGAKDVDYLVVNRHVLSDTYLDIKPLFYVLADPHFFSHPEGMNILKKINDITSWNMVLCIPYSRAVKKKNSYITNKHITVLLYNSYSFKGYKWLETYLYKRNLSIPRVQNVLVASIYIAISARYNLVKLYGVEHSWTKYLFVDDENDVCLLNPHFYNESEVPKKWKEIQNEDAKLHEVLRMYAYMFEAYWNLKEYANNAGVHILNCTKASFIDAFDKK